MGRLLTQTQPGGFANQTTFADALAEAVRWMRGLVFHTLHYLSLTDTTMPMVARVLHEANSHVFVTDDLFRNIARQAFDERSLWDKTLHFTASPIGRELLHAYQSGPAHLSPILLQHADAQRIPLPPYPPPTPLVTTTTHAVDKVQQDGKKQVVEITHHYRHAEHYDN